jgi:hypothetical protein
MNRSISPSIGAATAMAAWLGRLSPISAAKALLA